MILFGDEMNSLEINKILSKMIKNTENICLEMEVSRIKQSLAIDKTNKK